MLSASHFNFSCLLGGRGYSGAQSLRLTLSCRLPLWPKQEERIRRGDDLRLQMAIEESRRETGGQGEVSVGEGTGGK